MKKVLLVVIGIAGLISLPFTEVLMFRNPTVPGFNPIGAFMATVVAVIAALLVAIIVKQPPP
jgi:hypothetical protein